jgi:hypothetical protein
LISMFNTGIYKIQITPSLVSGLYWQARSRPGTYIIF